MRKVLITLCDDTPEYREMLAVAGPTHAKYAAIHGYDYYMASADSVRSQSHGRHPSWAKIQLLAQMGHEFKLFLDADVAVVQYDKDILDDFPDGKKFGMVVHHTSDGAVPNCGVLACRGDIGVEMAEIWRRDDFVRSSCWWEQAGMISLLGGDPDATPVEVPPGPLWGELPYEWNPHVFDRRGLVDTLRFFHATQCQNRPGALRSMRGNP